MHTAVHDICTDANVVGAITCGLSAGGWIVQNQSPHREVVYGEGLDRCGVARCGAWDGGCEVVGCRIEGLGIEG